MPQDLVSTLNDYLVKMDEIGFAIQTEKKKIDTNTIYKSWDAIIESNNIVDTLKYTDTSIHDKVQFYHQAICDDLISALKQSPLAYRWLHYSHYHTVSYSDRIYDYIKTLDHLYQNITRHRDICVDIEYKAKKELYVDRGLCDMQEYIADMVQGFATAVEFTKQEQIPHISSDLKYVTKSLLLQCIASTIKYITVSCDLIQHSITKKTNHTLFVRYDDQIKKIQEDLCVLCRDPLIIDAPSLCAFAQAKDRFTHLLMQHNKLSK